MLRLIGGAVAGIVAWVVIVSALDIGLRHFWPDYAAVEKAMTFTLPMMAARLSMSGVSSLVGGAVAAVAGRSTRAALVAGTILALIFLPIHYSLWSRFPLWYHLTFLISLPLLSVVGAQLAGRRNAAA